MRLPPLFWTGLLALALEASPPEPLWGAQPKGSLAAVPAPAPAASGRYAIPAEPQRSGDPKAGYDTLVNGSYVSCGVPWSIYRMAFGDAPARLRLKGRRGHSAKLSYELTALKTPRGVEVVTANCLGCHATARPPSLMPPSASASTTPPCRATPTRAISSGMSCRMHSDMPSSST